MKGVPNSTIKHTANMLYNGNEKEDEPPIQEQGSIIVFASNLWHRIAPVTKGVRYSLVSWIFGPPFQ